MCISFSLDVTSGRVYKEGLEVDTVQYSESNKREEVTSSKCGESVFGSESV